MEKLLIFGDSWPQGSELRPNQIPFGELLAKKLGIPCMNFSMPSTSIPHLLLQLQVACQNNHHRKFDHRGSDAVFFLTSPDRDMMWRAGENKELHLNPSHPNDEDILYYSRFYSPELASFRVNTSLLAIQKFCEIHALRDHYIWGWQIIDLWPEVDRSKFWRNGSASVLDLFGENDKILFNGTLNDYINNKNNRFVYPNSGHPNQRGHELIANELARWLGPCT